MTKLEKIFLKGTQLRIENIKENKKEYPFQYIEGYITGLTEAENLLEVCIKIARRKEINKIEET